MKVKIIKSKRKTLAIYVKSAENVVVKAPFLMPEFLIKRFLNKKKDWILKTQKKLRENPAKKILNSRSHYLKQKSKVEVLVRERLNHFNSFYNFKINGISVKNQSTRWGSCSSKGNLNFNYKIIYLTKSQQDYIVVHELCHLEQMNHSRNFWELVSQTLPNYKKIKKEIK